MEQEKVCASKIMKKHAMCLTVKERAKNGVLLSFILKEATPLNI